MKKYTSLKLELKVLSGKLKENPTLGTPLGGNAFKLELPLKAKEKVKTEEQE